MAKLPAFFFTIIALLVGVSLIQALMPGMIDGVPDVWAMLRDPAMAQFDLSGAQTARRIDYIALCISLGLVFLLIANIRER